MHPSPTQMSLEAGAVAVVVAGDSVGVVVDAVAGDVGAAVAVAVAVVGGVVDGGVVDMEESQQCC